METIKRLLVIGDNENAPYHPLSAIEEELKTICNNQFSLEFKENYSELRFTSIRDYDAVISYTDCWSCKITTELATALQSFVINGGALLVIHNGISLQGQYELAQMIGAKFVTHPERSKLSYTDYNQEHPIMKDVKEFSLFEEPYQFEFDAFTEKTILFHYVYEGKKYAAAWAHNYGLGRVVYLSPGHDTGVFQCAEYRRIISNSLSWLTNFSVKSN